MSNKLFYLEEDESSSIWKPFVEKFVEGNPDEIGERYEVISVEKAKSGTGHKVETDRFVVFLRSNSTILRHLIEALVTWGHNPGSPALIIELTGSKPFYRIAVNPEAKRSWYLSGGKYTVAGNNTGESRKGGNPFLQPSTRPPVPDAQEDLPYPGQEMEPPREKKRRAS